MKPVMILLISFLLGGCFSVYKDTFNCKSRPGIGCESVTMVNELVDEEQLDEFTEKQQKQDCKKCNKSHQASIEHTIQPQKEMRVLFSGDEEILIN